MSLGIGGGAAMGIALEVLPPPVQAALATAGTGGTITAGTYRYVLTAINANGETTASNEQTIVTTGSTSTVTVTWGAVTGATGYRLYKTAAGGGTGTELFYKAVGAVTSDVDTAPGVPVGAFPTKNTAYNPGTYYAPTKFVPFLSESLTYQQANIYRRPIRRSVGVVGAVLGNSHVQGDVGMEALEDVLPYFLAASRLTITKTGSAPNFTYTCVPSSIAIPSNTLSIAIERVDGQVFGYTGCIVSSFKFGLQDGLLTYTAAILARDEASQAILSPTWPTTTPFGPGMYSIEFPTGTAVEDTDTFEWSVEDSAVPEFRLKNTGRGASFNRYGERTSMLTAERDFINRTDYDNFKTGVSQSTTIAASKGANNSVSILVPVNFADTVEITIPSQGDLVRRRIQYQNLVDGTGKEYQITLKTQEDVSI